MAEGLLHPVSPQLEASPMGLLGNDPLGDVGFGNCLFFGKERRWGWMVLFARAGTKRGASLRSASAPCSVDTWAGSPLLRGLQDMGFLVGCVLTAPWARLRGCGRAKQPGRTELGAQRGHPGLVVPSAPSVPSARELPRCLLLTGSCLPKGRKMTLKHYFKLRWDVVAWCSFPPLRRVVHTPWGRSHAAQRSVGWTCLPAA